MNRRNFMGSLVGLLSFSCWLKPRAEWNRWIRCRIVKVHPIMELVPKRVVPLPVGRIVRRRVRPTFSADDSVYTETRTYG